ncbi:uncharacterized protein LOC116652663 [Coturnix japonica]|uniref:uncharacterized protein LOC116652663 n=1 Tax=Coturnix japonica TaxID=93934 RepID=UPI0013A5DD7D|nr:uncharacterized protein LOC116652663 [Coturnix japonica]
MVVQSPALCNARVQTLCAMALVTRGHVQHYGARASCTRLPIDSARPRATQCPCSKGSCNTKEVHAQRRRATACLHKRCPLVQQALARALVQKQGALCSRPCARTGIFVHPLFCTRAHCEQELVQRDLCTTPCARRVPFVHQHCARGHRDLVQWDLCTSPRARRVPLCTNIVHKDTIMHKSLCNGTRAPLLVQEGGNLCTNIVHEGTETLCYGTCAPALVQEGVPLCTNIFHEDTIVHKRSCNGTCAPLLVQEGGNLCTNIVHEGTESSCNGTCAPPLVQEGVLVNNIGAQQDTSCTRAGARAPLHELLCTVVYKTGAPTLYTRTSLVQHHSCKATILVQQTLRVQQRPTCAPALVQEGVLLCTNIVHEDTKSLCTTPRA